MLNFKNALDVFLLFLVPIGGGIPAGVILAKSYSFPWPLMMVLYFLSDVVLAIVFDPLMWLFARAGERIAFLGKFIAAVKFSMAKTAEKFGGKPQFLTLVMVSFGVDPMTGRSAALLAGHGFLMGWTVAILGDLMYFAVIMVSTLWLSDVLGDGTWATIIIMLAMFILPALFRRLRGAWLVRKQLK
jgi:uncharacterized membrane protein